MYIAKKMLVYSIGTGGLMQSNPLHFFILIIFYHIFNRKLICFHKIILRDRPIFRADLQIQTTFGLGWVGGFTEMGCSIYRFFWSQMFIFRGGWVSCNPNEILDDPYWMLPFYGTIPPNPLH